MQTTDFVALYRGQTVTDARLVAATTEPEVVGQFIRALVGDKEQAASSKTRVKEPLQLLRGDGGGPESEE